MEKSRFSPFSPGRRNFPMRNGWVDMQKRRGKINQMTDFVCSYISTKARIRAYTLSQLVSPKVLFSSRQTEITSCLPFSVFSPSLICYACIHILVEYYCLLFIVQEGPRKAEGDDTNENMFSQGPWGKPPRHYTILAPSTRSRYTRNIWPEPLMGYLWG